MTATVPKRKRILYLYSEVMGYTLATIRELVADGKAEVHVVHWDQGKLTPFKPGAFEGLHLYARSSLNARRLRQFVRGLAPDIAVVSGWQDPAYLPAALALRRRGIPVVVGFDDQWCGTLRQRIAIAGRPALRAIFSHAWVTGPRQYDYARRWGFSASDIIHDLYSADLRLFRAAGRSSQPHRARRFIFVGRLERVKGIDVLLAAWDRIRLDLPDWELLLVGNGSLQAAAAAAGQVRAKAFLSPEDIGRELGTASAFVLPSRHEPWGVVLHEAVAAGLPVLCSRSVGAAATFVVDGFNGLLFEPDSPTDLARVLRAFSVLGEDELRVMGERSRSLSDRITPATSAANLLSLLSPTHERSDRN